MLMNKVKKIMLNKMKKNMSEKAVSLISRLKSTNLISTLVRYYEKLAVWMFDFNQEDNTPNYKVFGLNKEIFKLSFKEGSLKSNIIAFSAGFCILFLLNIFFFIMIELL